MQNRGKLYHKRMLFQPGVCKLQSRRDSAQGASPLYSSPSGVVDIYCNGAQSPAAPLQGVLFCTWSASPVHNNTPFVLLKDPNAPWIPVGWKKLKVLHYPLSVKLPSDSRTSKEDLSMYCFSWMKWAGPPHTKIWFSRRTQTFSLGLLCASVRAVAASRPWQKPPVLVTTSCLTPGSLQQTGNFPRVGPLETVSVP